MKTMIVTLTNEVADQIEATARDQGLTPDDVLHLAVAAYLGEFSRREPKKSEIDQRPDLWFVGLASSRDATPLKGGPPRTLNEEIAQAVWEDSFGGQRPWIESEEEDGSPGVPDDRPEPAP